MTLQLPAWSQVSDKRRAHIERVTALLDRWAQALHLDSATAQAWHDVGAWHDAMRDAPNDLIQSFVPNEKRPIETLHGHAVAARLAEEGEGRSDVLEAIRWHTTGHPEWDRTGRALYMADFLEPGRPFMQDARAFLAAHLVHDFDGVFKQVLRMRIEWNVREGKPLFPETVALWNRIR
jgi:HD superfamily phosphohydrolase YqeK